MWVPLLSMASPALAAEEEGGDFDVILQRGVLRHLGIPYANFVTGGGDVGSTWSWPAASRPTSGCATSS